MEYAIKRATGYSEKIGELVFMMNHVREGTLQTISGWNEAQLDFITHDTANSPGALLAHIAAIEKVHQLIAFENRDFSAEEWTEWGTAIELGAKAREDIGGHSVSHYVEKLAAVRAVTLSQLKKKNDSWLYEERCWPNDVPYNMYYLWFHVLEDEISHRGQIRAMSGQFREAGKSR